MPEKRHLKVIAASPEQDEVPRRSSGQWVVLGGILITIAWLPLAMLGLWGTRLLGAAWTQRGGAAGASWGYALAQFAATIPLLGSFVSAAYIGGLVVARFGPTRHRAPAGLAGAFAGVSIASLAATQGVLSPWQVGAAAYAALAGAGFLAARWGGGHGRRMYYAANVTERPAP